MFNYSLAPRATPDPSTPSSSLLPVNRMGREITVDEVPHLAYSSIRNFSQCPLQWRLSRKFTPAFIPASLLFGGGIHAGIKVFYRARQAGRVAEFGELLDAYGRHWVEATAAGNPPVRFSSKLKDADVMLNLASRMLAEFLVVARPGEVIAVDEPFAVAIAPDLPSITGRIDLVEVREDADKVRRLHLVDFKTVTRRSAKNSLDTDRLLLYALAAWQAGWTDGSGLPLALRFDVFARQKWPEIVSVPVAATRHDFGRLVEKIRQCGRSMEEGVSYPAPSWSCSLCGFGKQCRRWPRLPVATAA